MFCGCQEGAGREEWKRNAEGARDDGETGRLGGDGCAAGHPGAAAEKKPAPPPPFPEAKPAVSIEVAPLGYRPPGAFYLTYQLSSAAMGFFDDDHLLFTFRTGGLLKREPGDRWGDDDQEIRAVVLDLGTGKVAQQAKWRMHDRSQYLWPYKDGQFLVRVRDSLFITNQELELEPYMTFAAGIRAVQVSPDRTLLVVETNDPPKLGAATGTRSFWAGRR